MDKYIATLKRRSAELGAEISTATAELDALLAESDSAGALELATTFVRGIWALHERGCSRVSASLAG